MAFKAIGVIHCDLKHNNVLVDVTQNRAAVCDFGIAQIDMDSAGVRNESRRYGTICSCCSLK